jgi:hypothetical protein
MITLLSRPGVVAVRLRSARPEGWVFRSGLNLAGSSPLEHLRLDVDTETLAVHGPAAVEARARLGPLTERGDILLLDAADCGCELLLADLRVLSYEDVAAANVEVAWRGGKV